jgi:hypothetical protein
MTTIASPYKYSPAGQRTAAWRRARYQRTVIKGEILLDVLQDIHASPARKAAAIVAFREVLEEQRAVLQREGVA